MRTNRQRIEEKAKDYCLDVERLEYDRDYREWRMMCSQDARHETFYGSADDVISAIEYEFTKPVNCDCCQTQSNPDDWGTTGYMNGDLPICPLCMAVDSMEV